MRPLTRSQASRCEQAKSKRCKCRCGGRLHGAYRGEPEDFPFSDPHFAAPSRYGAVQLPLYRKEGARA